MVSNHRELGGGTGGGRFEAGCLKGRIRPTFDDPRHADPDKRAVRPHQPRFWECLFSPQAHIHFAGIPTSSFRF